MIDWKVWSYDVVREFNDQQYRQLLTKAHLVNGRTPINHGTKDDPDYQVYYILSKDKKEYALNEAHIEELPILPTVTKRKIHYSRVYDIVTEFKKAKFKAEKNLSFREIIDDLCCFEHTNPEDYVLYKIIVLSSWIDRLCCRISSSPGFGKDSVAKIVGDLFSNVFVIANPTVAKLEYGLVNKIVMLNELANMSGEERKAMEHFLLATGDMSNVYEKRSRSGGGTTESYDISKLSLLIAYNDLDCYPEGVMYFDKIFQRATQSRFIPFRFAGNFTTQFTRLPEAKEIAAENNEFYRSFIRSVMWYQENWTQEFANKAFTFITGRERGLSERWAGNFDTICRFICLYAQTQEEANTLCEALYQRHVNYLRMVDSYEQNIFSI